MDKEKAAARKRKELAKQVEQNQNDKHQKMRNTFLI